MKKILIFYILFSAYGTSLKAQHIYYAPIEKELFNSSAYTHIIGKMNGKILIWKYNPNFHKTNLLVYDNHMRLLNNVQIDFSFPGNAYKLFFIKRANNFSVIYQYYDFNQFYCKTATYSETGELIKPPVILENIKKAKLSGKEFFDCVLSENNREFNMYRLRVDSDITKMVIEYIQFDSNMDSAQLKIAYIPAVNKNSYVTNPLLDNKGNLIFFELSTDSESSILNIFKIEKNTDTLIIATNKWSGNRIVDIKLVADNRHSRYLITAVFGNENYSGDTLKSYTPSGIFVLYVKDDLSVEQVTNFNYFKNISGINNIITDKTNISFSRILNSEDGGFIISFNIENIVRKGRQDSRYYLEPANIYLHRNDSAAISTGPPQRYDHPFGSYDYNNYAVPYGKPSINYNTLLRIPIPKYNYNPFSDENNTANRIMVLKIGSDKLVKWGRILSPQMEDGFISHVEYNAAISINNDAHFIYPRVLKKNAFILGDALIRDDRTLQINNIIAAVANFRFALSQGIQIDDHDIVFPCEVRQRLSFAKMEF